MEKELHKDIFMRLLLYFIVSFFLLSFSLNYSDDLYKKIVIIVCFTYTYMSLPYFYSIFKSDSKLYLLIIILILVIQIFSYLYSYLYLGVILTFFLLIGFYSSSKLNISLHDIYSIKIPLKIFFQFSNQKINIVIAILLIIAIITTLI